MTGIIKKLQGYVVDSDYDLFSGSEMMVVGCVFNLGQLGETTNKVYEDFETDYPESYGDKYMS